MPVPSGAMRPKIPFLPVSAAALLAAGCGLLQASVPASTEPPKASAAPSETASSAPAATSKASAAPAAIPATEKGRTACGTGTCAAGAEICCEVEGAPTTCAPAPAALPAENDAAYPKVFTSCIPVSKDGEGHGGAFSLCDDSADCASGEVCCEAAFDSDMGPSLRRCTANRGACAGPELCRESTCATAGTACSDTGAGQCRPAGVKMTCGAETCSGATPVCYAAMKSSGKGYDTKCGKVGKRPEGDDAPTTAYECASNKDCPAGTVCGGSGNGEMGTLCVGFVDYGMTAVACRTQADCKGVVVPFSPETKLTCKKAGGPSKLSFCLPP